MTDAQRSRAASRLSESAASYLPDARGGTSKLSISLPTPVLESVRDVARERGTTVSAVIAAALRSALETGAPHREWPPALVGLARLRGQPVDELVDEAIQAWLDSNHIRPVPADEWRRRFGALLDRRAGVAAAANWSDDDIEADVAAAVREVREARAADRR